MRDLLANDETKLSIKLKIFYAVIITICVVSLIAAIVIQINKDNKVPTEKPSTSTEETDNTAKEEFYEMFTNKVNYMENNSYKIVKNEEDREIIYTGYRKKENKINDYEIDVSIPYININNEKITEFNDKIKDIFEKKAKNVLNTKDGNIIYTVNYSAYITNNILSLVVRSTLKEGTNPQREIVQTYNYDLTNQKEYTIQDVLKYKGITKQEANEAIKAEIKKVQESVKKLEGLGYNIYSRDPESDVYNINNVTEFFIGKDDKLYIVYAYGNENNTSEMDIVTM